VQENHWGPNWQRHLMPLTVPFLWPIGQWTDKHGNHIPLFCCDCIGCCSTLAAWCCPSAPPNACMPCALDCMSPGIGCCVIDCTCGTWPGVLWPVCWRPDPKLPAWRIPTFRGGIGYVGNWGRNWFVSPGLPERFGGLCCGWPAQDHPWAMPSDPERRAANRIYMPGLFMSFRVLWSLNIRFSIHWGLRSVRHTCNALRS